MGKTILVSSHILPELADICNKIGIIERGQLLFDGDVESAIKSANAIGDDRLQRRSGGFVHPEKFTHGTSAQRVKWFKDGLETGDATKQKLDHFFTVRYSKEL